MQRFERMGLRRYAAWSGMGLSLALAGCDPQASPFFRGESLFTVHGSVSIAENHTSGRLVPALAFVNRQDGAIQILEVGVKGEFPSDFRLDVFSPPADGAFMQLEDFGEHEARVALGYITAVSEDHPDSFQFGTTQSVSQSASRGVIDNTWCTDEAQTNCYTEKEVCPAPDSPPEDCHIEATGDPSIKEPMWRFFAGFSQNYAIAYLKDAARSGSGTAAALGAPDGLARGYHLLRMRDYTKALQEQYESCQERSYRHGVDRYNEQHDTNYRPEDIDIVACGAGPGPNCTPAGQCEPSLPKPKLCDLPWQEQERVFEQVRVLGQRAQVELGCLVSQFAPVADPKSESIAIEIAPNAAPGFGPNEEPVF